MSSGAAVSRPSETAAASAATRSVRSATRRRGALPLLLDARERLEALPCPVEEGEHLLLAPPVLALERVERADPFADLLQPRGVELEPFAVRTSTASSVAAALSSNARTASSPAAGSTSPAARSSADADPRASAALLGRERTLGRRGPLEQPAGVVEPGRLELQLLGLARPRRRDLDLANLVGEQVHLALAVALALVELGEGGPRVAEASVLDAEGLDGVEVLSAPA